MATHTTETKPTRSAAIHDLVSGLVLAVATVLTAWCAYQGGGWSSTAAAASGRATRTGIESERANSRAVAFAEIDVELWSDWIDAVFDEYGPSGPPLDSDGRYVPEPGTRSGFYYETFRTEAFPAFNAWLRGDPFADPAGPRVPFATDAYQLEEAVRAERLQEQAAEFSVEAASAADHTRDYVALTVVFASALALAGLTARLRARALRDVAVGLAGVILVVGAGVLTQLPTS